MISLVLGWSLPKHLKDKSAALFRTFSSCCLFFGGLLGLRRIVCMKRGRDKGEKEMTKPAQIET